MIHRDHDHVLSHLPVPPAPIPPEAPLPLVDHLRHDRLLHQEEGGSPPIHHILRLRQTGEEVGGGGGRSDIQLDDLLEVGERRLTDLPAHLVIHGLDLSQRTVEDALDAPLVEATGGGGAGGSTGVQEGQSAGWGLLLRRLVILVVDCHVFAGLIE